MSWLWKNTLLSTEVTAEGFWVLGPPKSAASACFLYPDVELKKILSGILATNLSPGEPSELSEPWEKLRESSSCVLSA